MQKRKRAHLLLELFNQIPIETRIETRRMVIASQTDSARLLDATRVKSWVANDPRMRAIIKTEWKDAKEWAENMSHGPAVM